MESIGKERKEKDGVGLPPKTVPVRDKPGYIILDRTPGKPLIDVSFYLQNMSLRSDPGEKLRVNPLIRRPCLPRRK